MKKVFFTILSGIISIVLFFSVCEFSLFLLHRITHNWRFDVMVSNIAPISDYPQNPKEYLKIAIFGGSAAYGYDAERGFKEILEKKISTLYPNRKFYFKNFALPGYPFHRHQAELAKKALGDFDILIIYTGTNEAQNYIDDSGYYRKPEYINTKSLIPVPYTIKSSRSAKIKNYIDGHIRFFAFLKRIAHKFSKEKGPVSIYLRHEIKEFDSARVVPDLEMQKIVDNYKLDLEEIAKLAVQQNKIILVSDEVPDDDTPPTFSVFSKSSDKKNRSLFFNYLKNGTTQLEEKKYLEALKNLNLAYQIDKEVAVLNFRIGKALLALGKTEQGRKALRASIDLDGLTLRTPGAVFKSAQDIARKYPKNVFYIEGIKFITTLKDKHNFKPQEIFSDLVHPTMLGHTMLAEMFYCAMFKTSAFNSQNNSNECNSLTEIDFKTNYQKYKVLLGVTKKEESDNFLMQARWNLSMSSRSAYPEYFLSLADRYLNQFYENSDHSKDDQAAHFLYRFFLEGEKKEKNREKALSYIQKAFQSNPGYILLMFKESDTPTGEETRSVLDRLQIKFEKSTGKFTLKTQ